MRKGHKTNIKKEDKNTTFNPKGQITMTSYQLLPYF